VYNFTRNAIDRRTRNTQASAQATQRSTQATQKSKRKNENRNIVFFLRKTTQVKANENVRTMRKLSLFVELLFVGFTISFNSIAAYKLTYYA